MSDIKKVLVVDDDASLTSLLQDYLPKVFNHELFIALTGEEALKILEENRPDLLLLDMQLPGIHGVEVLRIIREKYPDTKVLVITSYDKQVKEEVEKLGVDGFFPKPLILNDVVNRIEDVLRSTEDTTVKPVALNDIQKKDGVIPKAKILFIEREFWMPYLLPITDGVKEYPPPITEAYGEYEFKAVYSQKEVPGMLSAFKPDIVIAATEVPLDEPQGHKSESTAELLKSITQSKHAPKAILVHGTHQSVTSAG
ncbi:MAG: response regulator, partial [Candidatus Omnitrophica bacterium]|nr:response regulator [Candidatus Omnitrophota bacterium]